MVVRPRPRPAATPVRLVSLLVSLCLVACLAELPALPLLGVHFALGAPAAASAQEIPPELLQEAARQTGLSPAELERRYRETRGGTAGASPGDSAAIREPGRRDLGGIDDRYPGGGRDEASYWGRLPTVNLPGGGADSGTAGPDLSDLLAADLPDSVVPFFGAEFFRLDAGVFQPPSFGPVPADYQVGVGDEMVVDVWGEVEFRVTRMVDRDGTIILPKGGKIVCQGRTLAQVEQEVRKKLAQSYSGISLEPGQGSTYLDVSLGELRSIRVFVVGDAVQPGSYELSSVATVFAALYAAGGPAAGGSMREVQLVRGADVVARLDLYAYLLGGRREGDVQLRDGDTVFVPTRGPSVRVRGAVRRPLRFELKAGEGVGELLRFAGGLVPQAAAEMVHVQRILPPAFRVPNRPDVVWLDISLDPTTGAPRDPAQAELFDGDVVSVGFIEERLENFVEIVGNVKRPGRYEFRPGLTARGLIAEAGGLWSDTLEERALVDRTDSLGYYSTLSFSLGVVMRGEAPSVLLQSQDVLRIFSIWDVQDRRQVHINGEVRKPVSVDYRAGMSLRDLILWADGLKPSADPLRAEVSRVRLASITSRDITTPPASTVEVLMVPLGKDYLAEGGAFLLEPFDRVVVRRLPWWELQRNVVVQGEVFYPGVYSLERPDETLSSIIARAGGLKPSAYTIGGRVVREQDGVGNIALDLVRALTEPGSAYDIILQPGDRIVVPDKQYTVKVVGEVGFPTSMVWETGKKIDWYVERAGGYLENSDKDKARVVHPNGMSLPNAKGAQVLAGSTIIVPVKPPPEGPSTLELVREITVILGALATVWLAIDRGTR